MLSFGERGTKGIIEHEFFFWLRSQLFVVITKLKVVMLVYKSSVVISHECIYQGIIHIANGNLARGRLIIA